jgi:hypothetical protein
MAVILCTGQEKGIRKQATGNKRRGYRLQEKKQWPAVAKLPPFLLRLKPEV